TIPACCISRAISPPIVAVREVLPPATTSTDSGGGEAFIASRTDRLSSWFIRATKAGPTARASGLSEPIQGGRTPRPSVASDASVDASQAGNSFIAMFLSRRLICCVSDSVGSAHLRWRLGCQLRGQHLSRQG